MNSDDLFLALVIAAVSSGVSDPVSYAQRTYDQLYDLGRLPK